MDEVEEEHPSTDVALGDRDDEAQVGLDELLLRIETDLLDPVQAPLLGPVQLGTELCGLFEPVCGLETGLDLHGEVDLLGRGQQRHLADLLQVHANRVTGQRGKVRRVGSTLLGLLLARLGGHFGQLDVDNGDLRRGVIVLLVVRRVVRLGDGNGVGDGIGVQDV